MGSNLKDIVKEGCKRKGVSLSKLALILGVNHVYLFGVLSGKKISRPLIKRIAETLHLTNLPSQYEIFLASRRVESKGDKPTQQKTKSYKGGVKP